MRTFNQEVKELRGEVSKGRLSKAEASGGGDSFVREGRDDWN